MRAFSVAAAALIAILGAASAFSAPAFTRRGMRGNSARFASLETLYEAVEYAEDRNKHDVDEMDRLASELEVVKDCNFETGAELCEKEIQDRIDVAEILRLKIELELRLDYLQKANLFAEDVKKEHDVVERRKFKEALMANREKSDAGSDLGLW